MSAYHVGKVLANLLPGEDSFFSVRGVVDGFHVGKIYEQVGNMCRYPEVHLQGIHNSSEKFENTSRVVGGV